MAKHIVIITVDYDQVESQILRHFTKSRFRRCLSEIDDDDIAIIGDLPVTSREVQALDCSATVISIIGFSAFEDDYDQTDIELADAVMAVSWLDVPEKARSILEPFAGMVRFAGCDDSTEIAESENFITVIDDIIQQF